MTGTASWQATYNSGCLSFIQQIWVLNAPYGNDAHRNFPSHLGAHRNTTGQSDTEPAGHLRLLPRLEVDAIDKLHNNDVKVKEGSRTK